MHARHKIITLYRYMHTLLSVFTMYIQCHASCLLELVESIIIINIIMNNIICYCMNNGIVSKSRLIYLSVIRELNKGLCIHANTSGSDSPTDPKLGSFSRNRMPLPGDSLLLRN